MKEKEDNLLIADFFAEHKKEVHDRGFTQEVMKKVERKHSFWSSFATFMGYALAVVLFLSLGGWNKLLSVLGLSAENAWTSIKNSLGITEITSYKEWDLNTFMLVAMAVSLTIVISILISNSRTRSLLSRLFS